MGDLVVRLEQAACLLILKSSANSRTNLNNQGRNANPSSVFKQIKNSVYCD